MAKKKPARVYVSCKTPAGFRWLRQNATGGVPPVAAIGTHNEPFTVFRPDRFADMLEASECRITETLAGSRRR